jgi:hypothetical protein
LPPKKNLKLSSARRSRVCGRGFLAAAGGENRSNYLYYPAPVRILQAISVRLASLGDHFVLNFGGKNQFAISLLGQENF